MTPAATDDRYRGRALAAPWRRIAAFLIDFVLLWIICTAIGWPLFDRLCTAGPWARLIGLTIFFPYFGILNSEVGDGQTFGKWLARVQVVDAKGRMISLPRSLLRSSILAVPIFLNQLPFPIGRAPFVSLVLLSLPFFGTAIAILYLLLFNRATRQGLHDFAARSYVVMADQRGPVTMRPFWRPHGVILFPLIAGSLLLPWYSYQAWKNDKSFDALLQDIRLAEAMDDVETASAGVSTIHAPDSPASQRVLTLSVTWRGRPEEDPNLAAGIADQVLKHDPLASRYDVVQVNTASGYDLGIASRWVTRKFAHTPAEWKAYIDAHPPSADGSEPQ